MMPAAGFLLPFGKSVSILATPAKGYLFGYWKDLDSGTIASTQVLYTTPAMPLALNLQAVFLQNPYVSGVYTGLLQGGSFAESGYVRLTLLSTGQFTALFHLGQASTTLKSAFSLTYSAATGLFTGSFLANGAKRPFTCALLQSQSEGFGYFQEPDGLTGSVVLQTEP